MSEGHSTTSKLHLPSLLVLCYAPIDKAVAQVKSDLLRSQPTLVAHTLEVLNGELDRLLKQIVVAKELGEDKPVYRELTKQFTTLSDRITQFKLAMIDVLVVNEQKVNEQQQQQQQQKSVKW